MLIAWRKKYCGLYLAFTALRSDRNQLRNVIPPFRLIRVTLDAIERLSSKGRNLKGALDVI